MNAPAEIMRALTDSAEVLRPPAPPPPRYPMLSGADLRALPALLWRIKGVFPASGLAAIYGASASGKSFLALHMAAELARGRDWFGYRVKRAPVVYLPLEGEAGFKLRCAAWEQEHGEPLPDALRLTMAPFKLTDSEDVEALAAAAAGVGPDPVIFIDTMNRAAPDEDENAPDGMGRILDGAKNLQRLTGGLVVLVHHTGKDASKGMRGHSSLFAALDGAIEVTRDDDRRGWRCAKSKDGKDGQEHAFTLHIHELGTDEDGDALTSCVVREDTSASTSETRRPSPPKGPNQRVFMDALRPLFRAGTAHGKGGALPTIAVSPWRPRLKPAPTR